MAPQIQNFLLFNGFVVLLLVGYMVFWRPRKNTSRLKLGQQAPKLDYQVSKQNYQPRPRPKFEAQNVRQLNVIFQFNGHDFDAYETLGVPAGSSIETVEAAYRELIASSSEDTHEFYKKAFESIRSKA